jgi:hypothetical protein
VHAECAKGHCESDCWLRFGFRMSTTQMLVSIQHASASHVSHPRAILAPNISVNNPWRQVEQRNWRQLAIYDYYYYDTARNRLLFFILQRNASQPVQPVASESEASNCKSSGGLYVGSSERLLVSNSTVLERGPVAIGFNAVFFAVRAAFLVILGSLAAGGAPFCSSIVRALCTW